MTGFSIRRRLVLLLLGSLVLVWTAMLVSTYLETREEIHELADTRLEEGARTLMLLDLKRLGALAGGAGAGDDDDHDGDDEHAKHIGFQVYDGGGTLLLRSPGSPAAAYLARDGYATLALGQKSWHSFAARDARNAYQVRVFEAPGMRDRLVNKSALRMAQLLLLALPVLALLIWVSVGHAMRPLTSMTGAIAQRDANNLEPINLDRIPAEVQGLVESLNHLLQRLSDSIGKERAFTADAAHELRTPLAAIKVQAQVALASHDESERRHAIGQVIAGVNRTTHLAQQLLLLARLDHPAAGAMQVADLAALAVECAGRYADAAIRKGISFDVSTQPGCVLKADPVALSVLIDNLIDNAIKYGRADGRIAIVVAREQAQLRLAVKDDGPGVALENRARLMDRFYRVEGNEAHGSGLGLSIANKIARAYHGTLSIGAGLDGAGLGVIVRFPA
jgi:two-component system, OmpR family, sensor histidine kinase QseC